MYPTIALFYPLSAESIIMYRYYRITGAMKKALSYNPPYSGAMFPW
jgi:trehalose/maltose hydrolase-like predicted phosphorylase